MVGLGRESKAGGWGVGGCRIIRCPHDSVGDGEGGVRQMVGWWGGCRRWRLEGPDGIVGSRKAAAASSAPCKGAHASDMWPPVFGTRHEAGAPDAHAPGTHGLSACQGRQCRKCACLHTPACGARRPQTPATRAASAACNAPILTDPHRCSQAMPAARREASAPFKSQASTGSWRRIAHMNYQPYQNCPHELNAGCGRHSAAWCSTACAETGRQHLVADVRLLTLLPERSSFFPVAPSRPWPQCHNVPTLLPVFPATKNSAQGRTREKTLLHPPGPPQTSWNLRWEWWGPICTFTCTYARLIDALDAHLAGARQVGSHPGRQADTRALAVDQLESKK
eukprot:358229-Chlamydomonas_euryale.AAC.10